MRVVFSPSGPLEYLTSRTRVDEYFDFLRRPGVEAVVALTDHFGTDYLRGVGLIMEDSPVWGSQWGRAE